MGSLSVVVIGLVVAGIALWMRRAGSAPGPRLTEDLAPAMLARAGFPVTRHNVAVLRERLGEEFLAEARALDGRGAAGTAEWDRVAAACERGRAVHADGADLSGWPQLVLDEIAAVDPGVAASVAHRCPSMLLDAVGSGHGVLGGSVFAPLPAPSPTGPVVPAPRPAADRLAPVLPTPRAAV